MMILSRCKTTNNPITTLRYSKVSFLLLLIKLLKGALDKYNIIPQLFPKKVVIFIPFEVLA